MRIGPEQRGAAAATVAALLLAGACSSSGNVPRDAAGAHDPKRAGAFQVVVDDVPSIFELVSVTWIQTPAGDSYSFEVEAGEDGANARAVRMRLTVAAGTTAINANCVITGSGALWLAYETLSNSAFTGMTGTECSGEFTAIPVTGGDRLTGDFRGVLAQQIGTGRVTETSGFVDVQVGVAAP